MNHKIQDMGALYHFIQLISHEECSFFLQKSTWLQMWLWLWLYKKLIVYNSSINKKLIFRYLCFRCHNYCFCAILTTKIISNTATALFRVSEQHDGVSFLNESTVKWFSSVAVTHSLTVTGGFNFTFKVSFHLKKVKYPYSTFYVYSIAVVLYLHV